jgi:hypothetical protein
MKKYLLFLLILAVLAAGCQAESATQPPSPTTAPPTTAVESTSPPQADAPTTAPLAVSPDLVLGETAPGCTMVTQFREPTEEEVSLFSPVDAVDQVLGADDAAVTIVEYGDFQ